jgi:hypothetical protein
VRFDKKSTIFNANPTIYDYYPYTDMIDNNQHLKPVVGKNFLLNFVNLEKDIIIKLTEHNNMYKALLP